MTSEGITFAVVEPDGSMRVTTAPTFHERVTALQSAVGGYMEMLVLAPDLVAFVDEDGNSKDLPRNMIGSLMLRALGSRANFGPAGAVLGPVVFVGSRAPAEASLTPDQLAMLNELHQTLGGI